ncbi:MAG: BtrH N-terminal domain-containing protein [Candidatus Hodarchaeales archaeon]
MEKSNSLTIIPDFHHQSGVHCTSSALRNVFAFHGEDMTEAMVFGLGLGMSLSYLKIPGMEPFFGGRNKDFVKDLCDILKINLNEYTSKDPETGWIRLKERTESNIPSVINIDMGYLPYQDLADDFHFGGHTIAVCGYNSRKDSVYVTDTHFSEILEVSVTVLGQIYFPKVKEFSN